MRDLPLAGNLLRDAALQRRRMECTCRLPILDNRGQVAKDEAVAGSCPCLGEDELSRRRPEKPSWPTFARNGNK